jgi:arylsulfatase A-like enzyme
LATRLLKLGVTGLISLLIMRGAWLLGKDGCDAIRARRSPALFALALPWLCALTLLLLWLTRLRLNAPLISKEGLQLVAFIGVAGLVVLIFFYFLGHLRAGRAAALLPLCAVVLAPLIAGQRTALRPEDLHADSGGANKSHKAVFLITIDSLRADTLSCYGSSAVQTPQIDSVARDGVIFSTAISASSWTLPSVASFMTGVSPAVHGATAWQKRLPDDFKTLAEHFKEAGYRTVAVGQNPVLDAARNIDQGFDEYHWISTETRHPGISLGRSLLGIFVKHEPESTTEQITRMVLDRLGHATEGPTFFWVHYYDPHMPYTPPKRFMDEASAATPFGLSFDEIERVRMGRFGTKQPERDWIKSLYEGEVRFVDEEVGRLLGAMKGLGIYDEATIVISSDHGEEFWEHGGFEHGHSMYQELLRVPLIVKFPGAVAGAHVHAPIGTEALPPTLLELAGLPYDAAAMTSPSFAAYLNPELPAPPAGSVSSFGTLYFEKLEAVTAPDYKYIRAVDFESEKLYDRSADPLELSPLNLTDHAAAADVARQILNKAHGLDRAAGTPEKENVVMDAATEESLRSLGYID